MVGSETRLDSDCSMHLPQYLILHVSSLRDEPLYLSLDHNQPPALPLELNSALIYNPIITFNLRPLHTLYISITKYSCAYASTIFASHLL